MKFFRSKKQSMLTTIMFGMLIVSFIMWGGATRNSSSTSVLTTVNGEDIPYEEFQRARAEKIEMYTQLFGGERKMNDNLIKMVERQVAQSLIAQKAMAQEAQRLGIVIGNEEIVQYLEKIPAFQDPRLKRFSPAIYRDRLKNNDMNPGTFENQIREELAIDRMRGLIDSSIEVSSPEILENYQLENSEATLDIASFDPTKLADSNKFPVSEATIQDQFKKRQAEYMTPQRRTALVASLNTSDWEQKIQPSEAEVKDFFEKTVKTSKDEQWSTPQVHALHILISDSSNKGLQKIKDIAKKITNVSQFKEAARKFSQDYSNAPMGGELGYFDEKAMVKPFAEAAFQKAKLNSVYGPVKTDFGYHLIWVLDRTTKDTSLENRKQQILFTLRKQKVSAQISALKKEIADKAQQKGADLEAVLKSKGFRLSETKPFDSKSRLEDLPYMFLQQALKSPKDQWEGPEEYQGNLYAFKVTKIVEPQLMSYAEAKPLIEKELRSDQIEKKINDWDAQLQSKKMDWAELRKDGADVSTHKNFKIFKADTVPGFSASEILSKALQELNQAHPISQPIFQEGHWVILRLSDWSPVPQQVPEAEMKRIKDELVQKKRTEVFEEYTKVLIKTAKIPDSFRKKYDL